MSEDESINTSMAVNPAIAVTPELAPMGHALAAINRNNNGSWKIRRKLIICTLVFCAICIGYIMYKGTDSRLYETIVTSAFSLAGAILGSYIFGAVYEDTKKNS
jgi:hypothetical protein